MSSRAEGADVAVIGCGIVGLAVAWRAAQAGLDVVAIDPAPGHGATHAAAGMLAPITEATFEDSRHLELTLASWRRYPAFIEELEDATGTSTGFDTTGTLMVARDSDDNSALEREHRHRMSLGLDVQRLTSSECRALEPALAPSVRGGVLAAGDHQVDPRLLVRALRDACAALGVRTIAQRAALRVSGDRVHGVGFADGSELATDQAVLAAGCWSGRVDGAPPSARAALRPVKGQVLRLGPAGAPLTRHVIRGIDVYAVPRADGSLVVGGTVEERGYDTSVTAGATYTLLRDAHELLPDVLEMTVREAMAGLRPGTPDNGPLLGRDGAHNLVVATGHYRNGVLLAPITADIVVALLTGTEPPVALDAFAPARFAPGTVPA